MATKKKASAKKTTTRKKATKKKVAAKSKKEGVNKSEAILAYKKANPDAGPTAIAEALTKRHGLDFSPAYVSTCLSNSGRKKSSRKKGGRKAASSGSSVTNGASAIESAADFAASVGGIEAAQELLSTLETIKSKL